MDQFVVALVAGLAAYLLWAFVGSYLAATIRDGWPDLYVRAGAPDPESFWFSRFGPGEFDGFTLFRRFRRVQVESRDILVQLELVCWLRWLQFAAIAACIIFLSMSYFGRSSA